MTIFDLFFLVLALTGLITLGAALVSALRGRTARGRLLLRRLAFVAAVYFVVLILVSVVTPRRFLSLGDDQCSDDWCLAVSGASHQSAADSVEWQLTFRLSSRMAGGSQRELGVVVYLKDSQGRRYDPIGPADGPPFDVRLGPLQRLTTTRHFRVPLDAYDLGLIISREGGPPDPRCCIIGDEGSLFHKRSVVRLE